MIRGSLLDSDRFLNLPDNTARVCFLCCLLRADDRGNLEAGLGPLVRMWRDFGVDSTEKAAAIGQTLADQDLVRFYDVAGKRYLHIPRFGQRMRSFKRACPPSPWCEKDDDSEGSPPSCQQVAATRGDSRPEGEVEVELKKKKPSGFITTGGTTTSVPVDKSRKPDGERANAKTGAQIHDWWKTNEGIEAKGRELKYPARRGELHGEYKSRIFDEIKRREQAVVSNGQVNV